MKASSLNERPCFQEGSSLSEGRDEASCSAAQTGGRIREIGARIEPHIVGMRRRFHQHPELSGHEAWTADAVCAELDSLGVPWRRVAGNGVIATIVGTAPDACDSQGTPRRRVALRADMDALPVTEKTDAP